MKFEIYKTRGVYRWRLLAGNGKTLATSKETYAVPRSCADAIVRVMQGLDLDVQHGLGIGVVWVEDLGEIPLGKLRRSSRSGRINLRKRSP